MYISNPSGNMLDEWYCCGEHAANYLMKNGCPVISMNGKNYYFVVNKKLYDNLSRVPFGLKLLDAIVSKL